MGCQVHLDSLWPIETRHKVDSSEFDPQFPHTVLLHFIIYGYFNAIFYCSDIKTSEVKSIFFLLGDSQLLLYLIEDLFDEVVSSCQVEVIYISKY